MLTFNAILRAARLNVAHYEDRIGPIDGNTWGYGVGLPIGRLAGVRYDHARTPQAEDSDLRDQSHHAVSAWLDPLGIWSVFR